MFLDRVVEHRHNRTQIQWTKDMVKHKHGGLKTQWNTNSKHCVYDILPPTTAMVDYAVGLGKLSANERFFNDAQTAVSL